ncbi:DUF2889 domain-containing protein [Ramlibacter sp.]|uniref:DUF2889 domain-containing protein n=1 Tax=Ramlibacter sp. TaxID=1917967 RepID=UPI003D12402D
MTLTDDVTREDLHFRRIDFRGCKRSDGLYEIVARLTDRKPYDFLPPSRDEWIPANDPIHDHEIRVLFDKDMVIRDIDSTMHVWPYVSCPGGGGTLKNFIGVTIGRGWNNEVRSRLPNADTCTHFKEMMIPLATAAIQTMVTQRDPASLHATDANGRPVKIDACHAYGESRELVLKLWPKFHKKVG